MSNHLQTYFHQNILQPSVSGGMMSTYQCSDQTGMLTEKAKDLRKRPGYQQRRDLHTDSLNVRTFLSDRTLTELEKELGKVGYCWTKRTEENRKRLTRNQIRPYFPLYRINKCFEGGVDSLYKENK